MTDEPIRTSVVQRLLDCRSHDEYHATVATFDATDEEKASTERLDAARLVELLQDRGHLSEGTTTIYDITHRQLRALAAVFEVAGRWWGPGTNDAKLGDLVKVLPDDSNRLVQHALGTGGFIPETPFPVDLLERKMNESTRDDSAARKSPGEEND